jgi:preprotein translocase subunit SecE
MNLDYLVADKILIMAKKSVKKNRKTKAVTKGKTAAQNHQKSSKFNLRRIKQFSSEVKSEFNKIAWPDKKHTVSSTGVVLLFVFLISLYLGTVDLVLGKLISFVIH